MLAEYADKLDKTQRNKDWDSAISSVLEESQRGSLPREFGHAAQACERAFSTLPDSEQKYVHQVSPDTRYAILMLSASFVEGGSGTGRQSTSQQQIAAVNHLIERVAREANASTGGTTKNG